MVQEDPTPGPMAPLSVGLKDRGPALREGHINSRGIQLNGSKVLSKYDAAPKTSADQCETPKLGKEGRDTIWVVSGIKIQIRINTPHRRFSASVDLMPYI